MSSPMAGMLLCLPGDSAQLKLSAYPLVDQSEANSSAPYSVWLIPVMEGANFNFCP